MGIICIVIGKKRIEQELFAGCMEELWGYFKIKVINILISL